MTEAKYSIVKEFQVALFGEQDYNAYAMFPLELARGNREICVSKLLELSGYNPGSSEGNSQVCNQCGKAGPECIGHPVILDLSSTGSVFVNEFAVQIITPLSKIMCRGCRQFTKDKTGKVFEAQELSKLGKERMTCACEEDGSEPSIEAIKEEAVPKVYTYQAGAKKLKKADFLELTEEPTAIRELFEDVFNNTPPDYVKKLRLDKEMIMRIFYDKMPLLPVSVQKMDFDRQNAGIVKEIPATTKSHESLIKEILDNMNLNRIKQFQREYTMNTQAERFAGNPSHLMNCDKKRGLFRNVATNKRCIGTVRAVATLGVCRAGEINVNGYAMDNSFFVFVVSDHNIKKLQSKVGQSVSHRVNVIDINSTNQHKTYKSLTPMSILRIGDVVLKRIENGDPIVISRQPILHRHSQIVYTAVRWKQYCLGLAEPHVKGHNADFDGDEINGQIGADLAARIEMDMITSRHNLTGAGDGLPQISILYNGIVGAYELSTDNTIDETLFKSLVKIIKGEDEQTMVSDANYISELDIDEEELKARLKETNKSERERIEEANEKAKKEAEKTNKERKQLVEAMRQREKERARNAREEPRFIPEFPEVKPEVLEPHIDIPYYSGRTLISMLFPRQLNYKRKAKKAPKKDSDDDETEAPLVQDKPETDVVIKNGILISGSLREADVSKGLIMAISQIDRYNSPFLFIDRGYAMMSAYISAKGLTISAEDYLMPGKEPGTKSTSVIPEEFTKSLEQASRDILALEQEKSEKTRASSDLIETDIDTILSNTIDLVGDRLEKGDYKTKDIAKISYMSGARGNKSNIATAVSLVGQMYLGSDRAGNGVPRLSYYSEPFSKNIFDKGFVRNSYSDGLNPAEVMGIANPARFSAFQTYLGTPESGNASRQIALHEAGIKVDMSLSLVSRDGKILDALYGYGCDSTKVAHRSNPLGDIECPVDVLQLLEIVNSMTEEELDNFE